MKTQSMSFAVRVAWWLRWYLLGVEVVAGLTGCQPDMDRVGRWVARAVTVRVRPSARGGGVKNFFARLD